MIENKGRNLEGEGTVENEKIEKPLESNTKEQDAVVNNETEETKDAIEDQIIEDNNVTGKIKVTNIEDDVAEGNKDPEESKDINIGDEIKEDLQQRAHLNRRL